MDPQQLTTTKKLYEEKNLFYIKKSIASAWIELNMILIQIRHSNPIRFSSNLYRFVSHVNAVAKKSLAQMRFY